MLPGPKDTLGKMAWPPHSRAMRGMPDMFKSKVKTKVKSKRDHKSGSSNLFPGDTGLQLLGKPGGWLKLQRGHPSGGKWIYEDS